MDTWTDKKFSNGKFLAKSEKSKYTHIKQIILSSTILEFTWLVIDSFMEENGLDPSPKKDITSPQYRRSPRNLEFSQSLATRYENSFQPHKKILVGTSEGARVNTMENKETKTD